MRKEIVFLSLLPLLIRSPIFAQRAEVAFSIGGLSASDRAGGVACEFVIGVTCPTSAPVNTPTRVSYQGTIAARLAEFRFGALSAEVPVLGAPTREVRERIDTLVTRLTFSSIFVTPGLKLRLLTSSRISPFVSVGAGFAHFGESPCSVCPSSKTTGAGQFGGGIDFGTSRFSFRTEVRDYISGTPNTISGLFATKPEPRLHNLFAGVGLVLKF